MEFVGTPVFGATPTSTAPSADTVAFTPSRLGASGGRTLPRFRGEDGVFKTMQDHIGRNTIYYGQALGNSATIIASIGGTNLTAVGTATVRNVATTNRLTRAKRLGYVSAATAGATAALYNSAVHNQYTLGSAGSPAAGGFLAVFRFGVSDAATVAGAHSFFGMSSAIGAPVAATSPATLLNQIGVGQVAGSANMQLVYGGSAAQTAVDLGANFPAANTTTLYELILYARPDANNVVSYRLENITTGNSTEGKITAATPGTQLPLNTTLLGPRLWRSNNATALAVGLDVVSYYLESDI